MIAETRIFRNARIPQCAFRLRDQAQTSHSMIDAPMRLPHLAWGLIRKPQQDLTNEPHNQKARATHGAPYGLSRLFQFRVFQIQLWECRAKRIDDAFGFQVARPEEDIPRQHCASQKCDHIREDPQCQAMIMYEAHTRLVHARLYRGAAPTRTRKSKIHLAAIEFARYRGTTASVLRLLFVYLAVKLLPLSRTAGVRSSIVPASKQRNSGRQNHGRVRYQAGR